MYLIYKTKQTMSIGFLSIYFLIFILLVFFIKNSFSYLWVFLLLFDIFFILNFYKLVFKITNEGIEFGFGIFKRFIKKEYIDSIYVDNSIGNFFGLGIISKNKKYAFVARKGEGLTIKLKNNIDFFISTNESEKLINIIKKEKYV